MKAKEYLEYQIKDLRMDIDMAEHNFEKEVTRQEKNYKFIIELAVDIKSMQERLAGIQKALEAMEMCEEQEGDQ